MDDRFNTIAGWALFAGIVALGPSILAGEMFRSERPEKMGYPIAGVEQAGEGGGAAEQPIETYLANLWDVIGEPIGQGKGFAFSDALSKKGGTWNWDNLSQWLTSPRAFAPGTKMTFAGLGSPQDRADVIAFLNSHSDAPKPLPTAPAATAAAAGTAPGTGPNNGPQKAEKEPTLPAKAAGTSPQTSGGGDQSGKTKP